MGKVIVISGGSDGIGKEIARRMAKENKVIILSPTKPKLELAAKELGCDFAVCDVRDFNECKETISSIVKKNKRIDCLINCAGLWIEGKLEDNDPESIKRVIDVNLLGTIYLCKAVIPVMKSQKTGTIVNISSQAGLYADKEREVYNATKFGVSGFTKGLELELIGYGIRVIGVYPGKVNTKLFEKTGVKKSMGNAIEPEEVAKVVDFVVSLKDTTLIPEVGIRYTGN